MKMIITLIGVLTLLAGAWPLIADYEFIPETLTKIPTTGPTYQLIIMGIGVIAILYGISKHKV